MRSAGIVVVVALLALAGCASDGGSSDSSPATSHQSSPAAPESAPVTTPTTAPTGFASTPVGAPCEAAMREAATSSEQNLGENDPELFAAAQTCTTAAEFGAAVIRFPDAAGSVSLSEPDAVQFLGIVCRDGATYAACVDGRAQGWFE